ncbi:hypothetical protein [Arsenicibacter rosenii]|uniref:Uncharacterized protein n=1 Tax=Arsenicibacter rosenii TaxID=1750698 RepID=A0A1S2VJJ6_9BACT|nr:hypothetical protein [Arsenicibacter rosenii]OIN58929.1 hypothetical protein BLX24_11945 [Arsenicibacter rosenii]
MRLILIIAVLSFVAQLLLPWWSMALVAAGCCYWQGKHAWQSFGQAFAGAALVWAAYALLIHVQTGGIMTNRMSQLIIKSTSPAGMLLLTPLVAGLVAGLAGLAGYYIRQAMAPSQQIVGKRA